GRGRIRERGCTEARCEPSGVAARAGDPGGGTGEAAGARARHRGLARGRAGERARRRDRGVVRGRDERDPPRGRLPAAGHGKRRQRGDQAADAAWRPPRAGRRPVARGGTARRAHARRGGDVARAPGSGAAAYPGGRRRQRVDAAVRMGGGHLAVSRETGLDRAQGRPERVRGNRPLTRGVAELKYRGGRHVLAMKANTIRSGLAAAALAVAALVAGCSKSDVDTTTPSFTVGGTVSGLTGSGLILQFNSAGNLSIAADGPYTFTTKVASGATYTVSVLGFPSAPTEACTVTNASGTAVAPVMNVNVSCGPGFLVGGTVSGLTGAGLTLRNNGVVDRPI